MTTNCSYGKREVTGPPSATSSLSNESLSTRGFALRIGLGERRRGGQADDFVTAQCFEKWLNAAVDEATHTTAVDHHLADP